MEGDTLSQASDSDIFLNNDLLRKRLRPVLVPFDPLSIRLLRRRLKQSQVQFASMIGISPSTLRNWEQGIREPEGAAKSLLKVVESNPDAVFKALYSQSA